MSDRFMGRGVVIGVSCAAMLAVLSAAPLWAQFQPANHFPSVPEDDGKFLALAGTEFATLSSGSLSFGLVVPASLPESVHACEPPLTGDCIYLAVFDGDTAGESPDADALADYDDLESLFSFLPDPCTDPGPPDPCVGELQHWDNLTPVSGSVPTVTGNQGTQVGFALFADPNQVASTKKGDFLGAWMGDRSDNDSRGPDALDPRWVAFSGDFEDPGFTGRGSDLTSFPDNDWWNLEVQLNGCAVGDPGCPLSATGINSFHMCIFYNPDFDPDPSVVDASPAALATLLGSYGPDDDVIELCSDIFDSSGVVRPDSYPETVSLFKVKGETDIQLLSRSFSFEGGQHNLADTTNLFPDWTPLLTRPQSGAYDPDFFLTANTRYDGEWVFNIALPANNPRREVVLFDGDFDYGTLSTVGDPSGLLFEGCSDLDDADSPASPDFVVAKGPQIACTGADDPTYGNLCVCSALPAGVTSCSLDGSIDQGAKANGVPADDSLFDQFRKIASPDPGIWPAEDRKCVVYEVRSPGTDGDLDTADDVIYRNPNPSSQREWEQFRIVSRCEVVDTDPNVRECACSNSIPGLAACPPGYPEALEEVFDPAMPDADQADVVVDDAQLPVGTWRVTVYGVDLSNLNAWATELSFCPPDSPFCGGGEEFPYKVGDTVWKDSDGDGKQSLNEPGIPGVQVNLIEAGQTLSSKMTGDEDLDQSISCEECNTGGDPAGPADPDPRNPVDEEGLFCFDVEVPPIPGLPPSQNCRQFVVEVDPSNFDEGGPLDGLVPTTESPQTDCEICEANGGAVTLNCDFGYADECIPDIDFEIDGEGAPLATGQIIDDEFAAFGVTITTNDPVNHPAMIFDSANPTGGDYDLGTPNETFGGPGIGSGGQAGQPGANALPRGKVLIISEDGNSSNPDDNAGGGTLIFDFAYGVRVDALQLLDIEESPGGTITARDGGGGVIVSVPIPTRGNNSFQTVSVGATGVRRLEVHFAGSGSVTDILFCVEEVPCEETVVRDDFDQQSFGNNDGPDDWAASWIEDDVAGAGPAAGNVKITSSALRLDDYPNTDTHPSAARTVDLSGAEFARLKFMFDTSSGVDHDDAIAVEVSADGGASWTLLETITGIVGQHWGMRDIDISAFISSQTTVRFRVSNKYGGSHEYFYLTHVEICGLCEAPPCTPVKVKDRFDSESFNGNDGPDDWSGPWDEYDTAGPGPTSGNVKVWGGWLWLNDYPNTNTHPSAARTVDLSGTTHATLSFDWKTWSGVDTSDAVVVEISSDGGANYTVLETFTGIHGAQTGWASYDITPYISHETTVRFRVSKYYGGSNEWFKVDWLKIEGDCD